MNTAQIRVKNGLFGDLIEPDRNKISIVMPAYNEERRIGKTLSAYLEFFNNLKKAKFLDYEIVVVLNACRDNTLGVVRQFQKSYKELLYLNLELGGKGYAIVEGFKDSLKRDNNLIGFVDADMATSPEAFYELVKNIRRGHGVIASRWMKESRVNTQQSVLRRITSRGFNFLTRSILRLNYHDTQCGAKLFRREAIASIINEIGITKWAFDIDLIYKLKRKNFKIIEIPTVWKDVTGSKLNLKKVPFQMFSAIIRLRLIYSPFGFIVRFYDKLPERAKVHSW